MRKLAASLMVFTFVAAALVSTFFGGSPSSAQDAPLLTTTPSHTPIFTPLAMLNADFEDGADERGKPFGWNSAGTKKRDRVKCLNGNVPGSANTSSDLRGQSIVSPQVKIFPPPEVCSFVFKGERPGKVSVLTQDVPIASSFQPGQPIAIGARIGGKNLAGNVQANALIPTPTLIPTVPPACGGEDCPLPVRLTPTPFPFPTLPPGSGGE